MGQVHLNPTQFSNLEEAAKASKQIGSFTETSENTGVIVTHDVTIDYTYDVTKQILTFNIGAKHSLAAKIAGDNVIENHITALLFNLEGLNKPATEPTPEALNAVQPPSDSPASPVEPSPIPPVSVEVKPTIPAETQGA
jgi:hypothetical protein